MAFNLPGILGRNGRARQDMVDSTLQSAQASARSDAENQVNKRAKTLDDSDLRRTGQAYKRSDNQATAQKSVKKQNYEDSSTGIHMGNAYEAAESKVADLKEKRSMGKAYHKEEYGEDRPTRGAIRSAKKDANALGNAARDAY